MKKLLLILALPIFFACNNKSNTDSSTKTDTTSTTSVTKEPECKVAMLTSDKDYVCGMTISDGGIADTAHYGGKVYGFCSSDCKDNFVKEPQKYLTKE